MFFFHEKRMATFFEILVQLVHLVWISYLVLCEKLVGRVEILQTIKEKHKNYQGYGEE